MQRNRPSVALQACLYQAARFRLAPISLILLEVIPALGEHAVSGHAVSLDEQAFEQFQEALAKSEKLLTQGDDRQAVQEIPWLIETVTTVCRGMEIENGTIQGNYFDKIIGELRHHYRASSLEQVLKWIDALSGFLSSSTGGIIRHGSNLKRSITLWSDEARLYCNPIRSYISFLFGEYQRMRKPN